MRVYILGYMYSGKSTLGRKLAKRLDYEFVDTDSLFETRYQITIKDFLHRYDEAAFRKLEREVLLSTIQYHNCVISTGGGTPCFSDNMAFIKQNGVSIYLEATPNLIMSRRVKSKKARPLLENLSHDEAQDLVTKQMKERSPYYELADLKFNADDISLNKIHEALIQK